MTEISGNAQHYDTRQAVIRLTPCDGELLLETIEWTPTYTRRAGMTVERAAVVLLRDALDNWLLYGATSP